ncbi:MAG: hypothetical protein ACYDDO_10335 [Acidiferrobacterales bacterium]
MARMPVGFMVLLIACIHGAHADSPYLRIPAGSTLVFHQDIEVTPPGTVVYIQDGQVKNFLAITQYYPHCVLAVAQSSGATQTVHPGEFLIYRSRVEIDPIANSADPAANRDITLSARPESPQMYETRMYLRSSSQADVRSLTCQQREDSASDANYVSVRQIRKVLGTLASLRLAPP